VCAKWRQLDETKMNVVRHGTNCASDMFENAEGLLTGRSMQQMVEVFMELPKSEQEVYTKKQKTARIFNSEQERVTAIVEQMSVKERQDLEEKALRQAIETVASMTPEERAQYESYDDAGILQLQRHWLRTMQRHMRTLKEEFGELGPNDADARTRLEMHFSTLIQLEQHIQDLKSEYYQQLNDEERISVQAKAKKNELETFKEMLEEARVAAKEGKKRLDRFHETDAEGPDNCQSCLVSELRQTHVEISKLEKRIESEKYFLKTQSKKTSSASTQTQTTTVTSGTTSKSAQSTTTE